jgi:hypothetical protein
MDVEYSFLHGYFHKEIYMEQPHGYAQNDYGLVFHLNKYLYGLKKAPLAWYAKMDIFLLDTGFSRFHSNPNAYVGDWV